MGNLIQIGIGVVIGVFIASYSPETAEQIRYLSLSLYDSIRAML